MTVYVVMPVFNRLEATRKMIDCLSAQITDENTYIIVVDDGSTDGTAAFLSTQSAVHVLDGDGSLWWGGAVSLAMQHVFTIAKTDDWILLVNNDTRIDPDFLQSLLNAGRSYPKSAIGSVVREENSGRMLSVGAVIDPFRFVVTDILNTVESCVEAGGGARVFNPDALSGRGVLLPLAALRAVGGMRTTWLPHYLADYELSLRLKSAGWSLLVIEDAAVYSAEEFGSSYSPHSLFKKFTSVRSPSYLPALMMFWWQASCWKLRMTLPLRAMLLFLFPVLRIK